MYEMTARTPDICRHPSHDNGGGRSALRGWATLALAFAGLLLFMFVIGPAVLETDAIAPLATFIEDNDIEANAYYYTENEEFFVAERHMRDHLGYMAQGGH